MCSYLKQVKFIVCDIQFEFIGGYMFKKLFLSSFLAISSFSMMDYGMGLTITTSEDLNLFSTTLQDGRAVGIAPFKQGENYIFGNLKQISFKNANYQGMKIVNLPENTTSVHIQVGKYENILQIKNANSYESQVVVSNFVYN